MTSPAWTRSIGVTAVGVLAEDAAELDTHVSIFAGREVEDTHQLDLISLSVGEDYFQLLLCDVWVACALDGGILAYDHVDVG